MPLKLNNQPIKKVQLNKGPHPYGEPQIYPATIVGINNLATHNSFAKPLTLLTDEKLVEGWLYSPTEHEIPNTQISGCILQTRYDTIIMANNYMSPANLRVEFHFNSSLIFWVNHIWDKVGGPTPSLRKCDIEIGVRGSGNRITLHTQTLGSANIQDKVFSQIYIDSNFNLVCSYDKSASSPNKGTLLFPSPLASNPISAPPVVLNNLIDYQNGNYPKITISGSSGMNGETLETAYTPYLNYRVGWNQFSQSI